MAHRPSKFAALYCERQAIDAERFGRHLIARSLPAPWRWLGGLLVAVNPTHFECDMELVLHCGNLTRSRDIESELREFAVDLRNRTFVRRHLRIRVSTHRLRRIFRDTLRSSDHMTSRRVST